MLLIMALLLTSVGAFAQSAGLPDPPPPRKSMKVELGSITSQNGQLYISFDIASSGTIVITGDDGYTHRQDFSCVAGETLCLKAPACGFFVRIEDLDGTLVKEVYIE